MTESTYIWTKKTILFYKHVCDNNIEYIEKEWMNIDEFIIPDMLTMAAKTSGIDDRSVFVFLNKMWNFKNKTYVNFNGNNCLHSASEGNGSLPGG